MNDSDLKNNIPKARKLSRKKLLVALFFLIFIIAIFFILQKKSQLVQSHEEPARYTIKYPKDWVFQARDNATEMSYEDSCEALVTTSKKFWIGFCGPYIWSLDTVVNGALQNRHTANGKRTDFSIDKHHAVMIESTSQTEPEIHVYVENVKLNEYTGKKKEDVAGKEQTQEEKAREKQNGEKLGTLDITFFPVINASYSKEEYEQAKSIFRDITASIQFLK